MLRTEAGERAVQDFLIQIDEVIRLDGNPEALQFMMTLWRISKHPDLSGAGGRIGSGRWHSRGSRSLPRRDTRRRNAGDHRSPDRSQPRRERQSPSSYELIKVTVREGVQQSP